MIAKTILQQIGGKRFATMTGSRNFIDMGNGLRMSLARNKTSANRRQAESRDKARFGYAEARRRKSRRLNRLDIIYDAGTDLYNMRFFRKTFSKLREARCPHGVIASRRLLFFFLNIYHPATQTAEKHEITI